MQQLLSLFSAIVTSLQNMEEGLVISDNRQPDLPIVYVNDGFLELTGYSFDEVVGYNCRFLQCDRTDQKELDRVRHAISHGEKVTVELWNQRKNGSTFLNRLSVIPVYELVAESVERPGEVSGFVQPAGRAPSFFVGIQTDVTTIRRAQEEAARLETLQLTMRTVNDIVLNAFNGLQIYRELLRETHNVDEATLAEFDTIITDATRKLRKIEGLKLLGTDSTRGVDVLKYD
jgi:PAS domain S-box-containing protein